MADKNPNPNPSTKTESKTERPSGGTNRPSFTPAPGEDKVGSLIIQKAYEGQGGVQIILEHQSVTELLEALGHGETITQEGGREEFKSFPVKRDNALRLSAKTPKGKEGKLIWGDTHTFHLQHQEDQEFFMLLHEAAKNAAFSIDILAVDGIAVRRRKGKGNQPTTLDENAC